MLTTTNCPNIVVACFCIRVIDATRVVIETIYHCYPAPYLTLHHCRRGSNKNTDECVCVFFLLELFITFDMLV